MTCELLFKGALRKFLIPIRTRYIGIVAAPSTDHISVGKGSKQSRENGAELNASRRELLFIKKNKTPKYGKAELRSFQKPQSEILSGGTTHSLRLNFSRNWMCGGIV